MLTGKVGTFAFLLNQHDGSPYLSAALCTLVQSMNTQELAEMKAYVKHNTFIQTED